MHTSCIVVLVDGKPCSGALFSCLKYLHGPSEDKTQGCRPLGLYKCKDGQVNDERRLLWKDKSHFKK